MNSSFQPLVRNDFKCLTIVLSLKTYSLKYENNFVDNEWNNRLFAKTSHSFDAFFT